MDARFAATGPLDEFNEVSQRCRPAVAEVDDLEAQVHVECRQHTSNGVSDKGVISLGGAVTEHPHLLSAKDGRGEEVQCHVRTALWAVDSEEAQAGCGDIVKVMIGIAQQFSSAFGGSVRGNRPVRGLLLTEGRVTSIAVY